MTNKEGNKKEALLKTLLNKRQVNPQIIKLLQNVKNIDIGKAVEFNEDLTYERIDLLVDHLTSEKLNGIKHINQYKEDLVKETMKVKDIDYLMWYCSLIKDYKDPFFTRCLKENLEKRLLREEEQKEYFFIKLIDEELLNLINTEVLESWDIKELEFNGEVYEFEFEELPEELGYLISLEKLVLGYYNRFHYLPDSIGRLQNLKELDLEDGVDLEYIPETILELKNLRKVILPLPIRNLKLSLVKLFLKHRGLKELILLISTNFKRFSFDLTKYKRILDNNEILEFVNALLLFEESYYKALDIFSPAFFDLILEKLQNEKDKEKKQNIKELFVRHLEIYFEIMDNIVRGSDYYHEDFMKLFSERYGSSLSSIFKEFTRGVFLSKDPEQFLKFYNQCWYLMLSEEDLEDLLRDSELDIIPKLDNHIKSWQYEYYEKVRDKWTIHLEKTINPHQRTIFVINDYLYVKRVEGNSFIYVNGKRIQQWPKVLLNIPKKKSFKPKSVRSIDDLVKRYKDNYKVPRTRHKVSPREKFFVFCSNLQAWSEHDYDTNLLYSKLAFHLLKKLSEARDPKAKIKYKEEIYKRIMAGDKNTVRFLREGKYFSDFSSEELSFIGGEIHSKIKDGEYSYIVLFFSRDYTIFFTKEKAREISKEFSQEIRQGNEMAIRYLLSYHDSIRFLAKDSIPMLTNVFQEIENLNMSKIVAVKEDGVSRRVKILSKILSYSLLNKLDHVKRYKKDLIEEIEKIEDEGKFLLCRHYVENMEVYKEEIVKRVMAGNSNVIRFLREKYYFSSFTTEELLSIGEEIHNKINNGDFSYLLLFFNQDYSIFFTEQKSEKILQEFSEEIQQGNELAIRFLLNNYYSVQFSKKESFRMLNSVFRKIENLDIRKVVAVNEGKLTDRVELISEILSQSSLGKLDHVKRYKKTVAEEIEKIEDDEDLQFS